MKKFINIFLLSILLQTINLKSLHQDLSNFDKGNNFNECLSNCRYYHRNVLKLSPGEGQGFCWNECFNNAKFHAKDTAGDRVS